MLLKEEETLEEVYEDPEEQEFEDDACDDEEEYEREWCD